MMRKFLLIGGLLYSLISYSQTTHSVLVKVNQGPKCGIVNAIDAPEQIQIFPNPTTTSFTIQSKWKDAEIRLCDTQGRIVKTGFIKDGQQDISVEGLNHGIYILIVTSESHVQQFKIKVQ